MIENDATYSCVAVYDPTMPGFTRRMVKECYMRRGQDITNEVIANHTTILKEVLGLETAIAMLKKELRGNDPHHALDYMEQIMLPRARYHLSNYESNFDGIEQYRQFRTPFRKV